MPLLEDYNPGDLELMHAVHVGGGQVPRRVRVFIDYLAEWLAELRIFDGGGGMAGGRVERIEPPRHGA